MGESDKENDKFFSDVLDFELEKNIHHGKAKNKSKFINNQK